MVAEELSWVPAGVDTGKASPARVYDYWLGGTHNFQADRDAARALMAVGPSARVFARENRAFLRRAVRTLADAGVQQFLDIGSGIPTQGNVHEIAQGALPGARVLYSDVDPVAVAHSRAMLIGNRQAAAVQGDLRAPREILDSPDARRLLDFSEPVGLILGAVLHFITDDDDPWQVVASLRDALAPGSYLVLSHLTTEGSPPGQSAALEKAYNRQVAARGTLRSRASIERFFAGFDILDPGVVYLPQWRPDAEPDVREDPAQLFTLAGAGRKRQRAAARSALSRGTAAAAGREAAVAEELSWVPAGVDTGKASPARVYDYWLGGTHNFLADRDAARALMALEPNAREITRANRQALARAVRYLAADGVRQFLDVGSGIPTQGNVHEVAQEAAPGSRVVYVDIDPVAVAHSRAILAGNPDAAAVRGDLREPGKILAGPEVGRLIDFSQPVGLLLVAVLHFLRDGDDPWQVVATFRDALAPGSYLVVSHALREGRVDAKTAEEAYRRSVDAQVSLRSKPEIERFFGGFDLVAPGVVYLPQWRPDDTAGPPGDPARIWWLIGVGRRNA